MTSILTTAHYCKILDKRVEFHGYNIKSAAAEVRPSFSVEKKCHGTCYYQTID
jgi:hypothetical protein